MDAGMMIETIKYIDITEILKYSYINPMVDNYIKARIFKYFDNNYKKYIKERERDDSFDLYIESYRYTKNIADNRYTSYNYLYRSKYCNRCGWSYPRKGYKGECAKCVKEYDDYINTWTESSIMYMNKNESWNHVEEFDLTQDYRSLF